MSSYVRFIGDGTGYRVDLSADDLIGRKWTIAKVGITDEYVRVDVKARPT